MEKSTNNNVPTSSRPSTPTASVPRSTDQGLLVKVPTLLDWRVNLHNATLSTKWEYLLENQLFTDVTFHVGEQREVIKCHSLVLKMQSKYFETLIVPDRRDYEIQNSTPLAFKKLLKYLYTDKLELTPEDAMDTLVLAKQFHLPALQGKCGRTVLEGLNVTNSPVILKKADEIGDKHLFIKAQEYVMRHANQVLFTENFKDLSLSSLQKLLQTSRSHWNVGELRILEAVKAWASAECARHGKPDTGANQYEVAKPAFEQINFKTLTAIEFTAHVVKPKLLPYDIMLGIQSDLIEEENTINAKRGGVGAGGSILHSPGPSTGFASTTESRNQYLYQAPPRKQLTPGLLSEVSSVQPTNLARLSSPGPLAPLNEDDIDYSVQYEDVYTLTRYTCLVTREWSPETNGSYKTSFSTSRTLNLCGVTLYGQSYGGTKYTDVTVKIVSYDETTPVSEFIVRSSLPDDGGEFYVQFERGVKLEKGEWYTIILSMNGRVYPYGTGGKKHYIIKAGKEMEQTIEFFFKNSIGHTGASYVRGQLPKIHFYL